MQLELELQDFHIIKIAHIKAAGISQSMMERIIHERFEALLKNEAQLQLPDDNRDRRTHHTQKLQICDNSSRPKAS